MPSKHHRGMPPPPPPNRAPEGTDERQWEQDKYRWLYREYPNYKMARSRLDAALAWICDQPMGTSLLDIGCGRGELLREFVDVDPVIVKGYEVVESLCGFSPGLSDKIRSDAMRCVHHFEGMHKIPEEDNSWDLVTCCDVMEHVLEADALAGIAEMIRVARKKVYLSISTTTDSWGRSLGPNEILHITIRPIDWWLDEIMEMPPENFTILHRGTDWFQLEIDVS